MESNGHTRRRFLKSTGSAAGVAVLAGCSGGSDSQDDNGGSGGTGTDESGTTTEDGETQQFDTNNRLNTVVDAVDSLDPIEGIDVNSGVIITQIFDTLTNYPNGEIAIESLLATDWQLSDDFTTYTFTLKEGVKFHNGEEVTAQDVIYSWERLAASENSLRSYFILSVMEVQHETDSEGNYVPGSMALNAPDDYTLEVNVANPFHSNLEMLAYNVFAVLPEGAVGDIEGYDGGMQQSEFATNSPVGAGPYEFVTWSSGSEAEVTRFDEYHGETATNSGVHWEIVSDADAKFNYAMNQNADLFNISIPKFQPGNVSDLSQDNLGRQIGKYGPLSNGETVNYAAVPTITSGAFLFNAERIPKPIRQAAAYALNQQEAVGAMFKGRGKAGYHWTPPNIFPGGAQRYDEHAQNNYPYGYNETQLQNAREVMEEAGYGDDNRFSFTMNTFTSLPVFEQAGNLLRDKLASVYIDMQVQPNPSLVSQGRQGNLDAWSWWWIMDWPAPDNYLQQVYPPNTDTSADSFITFLNWSGTEAAERASQAWDDIRSNPAPTEEDGQARNEAYLEMEEANWADVPLLPLYHPQTTEFWYDWVDIQPFGGAGPSRRKLNTVTVGERP